MTLQLQEIDPAVDFPALLRCLLAAYASPPQPLTEVFLPMRRLTPEAAASSLAEGAARLALWHASDPTSHWQKVVDIETGRVSGGACWHIYDGDTFAGADALEAVWYPDDGSRRFAEQALESMARPRSQVARRPHLYLNNVFTHPDYRRRGVWQQIMDWGTRKADKLGLEIFLDATPPGRPLYLANGLVELAETVTAPATDSPDEAWMEMAEKVPPFTSFLMWRPVGGKYEEGRTIKPSLA
ncbi:GNAT family acetyltransferase [Apiospora phragmitis]|uniref:GNAT family acetyltransferase n=1 Tax=Apiospora phragmitis TaxID=2905665 RepID=A0ABR1T3X2_9PEZI